MRKLMIATFAAGLTCFSSVAEAKPAKCELSLDGGGAYIGPCNFTPMEGGSFEITALNKSRNLVGDIQSIAVFVGKSADLPPNEAFYSYMRRNDVGRNGAQLTRQKNRPACWVGEYDKICVF